MDSRMKSAEELAEEYVIEQSIENCWHSNSRSADQSRIHWLSGYHAAERSSPVVLGLVEALKVAKEVLIILCEEKDCGCESGNAYAYEPGFTCGVHRCINRCEDAITAYQKATEGK